MSLELEQLVLTKADHWGDWSTIERRRVRSSSLSFAYIYLVPFAELMCV